MICVFSFPEIAWGKARGGSPAILYSFNGKELKPLWQREDIYDGEMSVEKDKVTIKFLKEDEYIAAVERNRQSSRHLATYQLTPSGLRFLEEHEIPF